MRTEADRRARLAPGRAAGVTEDMIRTVVHAFYAGVRKDAELAPIFDQAIGDQWDAHLAHMCDFWSSVLLMTGRFNGAPMAVHVALGELQPVHFARWLALFRQTARSCCPPEAATLFETRAEQIARSLQLGIAVGRGELPSPPPVPPSRAR